MSKIKQLALVALSGVLAFPVLAQDSSFTVDTSDAADAVDAVKDAITGLFTGNVIPAVLAVIGVALALALIFFGVRYMMRAGKVGSK